MTSQEFAQEWNEVFPGARIHQNELANPTEAFLTNALLTLLRSISININCSEFDPSCHDLETIRRNKLCMFQYVNDLYRSLHNKKFHYFEFIHPSECLASERCQLHVSISNSGPFQRPRRR